MTDTAQSATAQLRRFLALEDILIGHPDGIDGPRLAAGLTWARHGSTAADRKSLIGLFASRWQAAQDEGEWDGDAMAEGEKDLEEVTAAALIPEPTVDSPAVVIQKIAEVANVVGWQAGEPGMEIAGGIVSSLATHPEHIDRFLRGGSDLFIDGTIRPETGCLTWRATTGEMMNAEEFKKRLALKEEAE